MKPLLAWFILLFAIFTHGAVQQQQQQEEEIDGSGNTVKSAQFSVRLLNKFEHAVKLYWDAPGDDDDMFMMEIPKGQEVSVNTFPGHRFYATDLGGSDHLAAVHIGMGRQYSIGGAVAADAKVPRQEAVTTPSGSSVHIREDSPISIMGYRTDAMSAKFRCLTPYPIDYYYDDGQGGTRQGSLSLGKETTTNTYAGHVFFFTRAGKKHEVVVRYTMTQARSLYVIMDKNEPPPDTYLRAWEVRLYTPLSSPYQVPYLAPK